MQIATEILKQLGGNKFVAMTGSKNFIYAEKNETTPAPWLRMDLAKNTGNVNRLKITLNADDTYSLHFYKLRIVNHVEPKITNEKNFDGVYCDMLQSIFTQVTGLYTKL